MHPIVDKALKLPNKTKLAILFLVMALEGVAFFYFFQMPKYRQLKDLQSKLNDLQNKIQDSKKIADNLPRLKKEYEQLQVELTGALTELPNQKEIPSLLTGITSAGKNAGLDFLVFRPKAEEARDFYSAVPVDISVAGTFHNVAKFFVAVSDMPRIININNVSVADVKDVGGRTMMRVNCLATTFRFLEKKETKDEKKK